MVGNIHVIRAVVGHGPDHAELVAQVVPQPPVAAVLPDCAVEPGRGLGGDIAGIDVEPLQYRLARLGQLLHGVHDDDAVLDAQVLDERLVGELMDARLVSAQVDRHAVGDFVVDRLQEALAGGHRFSAIGLGRAHGGHFTPPGCLPSTTGWGIMMRWAAPLTSRPGAGKPTESHTMKCLFAILTCGLCFGLFASAGAAGEDDFASLERQFRELPIEARRLTGPLFWLHGDESKERLEMYVGKVAEGGNGCFTAESRPHSDWLGPGWYRDLGICLEAAKKHNLKMWIFDEKWWPSQGIGGTVPPRYAAKRMQASAVEAGRAENLRIRRLRRRPLHRRRGRPRNRRRKDRRG